MGLIELRDTMRFDASRETYRLLKRQLITKCLSYPFTFFYFPMKRHRKSKRSRNLRLRKLNKPPLTPKSQPELTLWSRLREALINDPLTHLGKLLNIILLFDKVI